MKISPSLLGALALAAAAASAPLPASADPSEVTKSWRTEDGWLTELRQHANGARVCATAKGFGDADRFGLSIVRSNEVAILTLVDEQRVPTEQGDMVFSSEGRPLGTFTANIAGRAWATTQADSRKVLHMVSELPAGPLSIRIGDRTYEADFAGIATAREQLGTCEAEARR